MQRGKVAWIRVAQLSVEAEKQASGESNRRDLRASKGSSVEAEFGPGCSGDRVSERPPHAEKE
ncbi:hypothetical protein LF1_52040 [Rubripirellula obstinata]|uniref:Uncharacterized protein n=1 Tax=Rubripirellula obstinata TaxID=406547 RepID=A0A5B1CBJ0_9BACT|nr:hypothetical protein LF1_52040 [Rubripirellula obstinata]